MSVPILSPRIELIIVTLYRDRRARSCSESDSVDTMEVRLLEAAKIPSQSP